MTVGYAMNRADLVMFDLQIHEREAYRAIFVFGGSLSGLDSTQVTNLPAAINNTRVFAAEVLSKLMTNKASSKSAQVA